MNSTLPIVEQLLEKAVRVHATDIHFHPAEKETSIHFRILGKRMYESTIPTFQYEHLLTYFKFTAGMDIDESRKPQDGSILRDFTNLGKFTLRLSTLPLPTLESLVIRILPQEEILSLDELFLFPNQFRSLLDMTDEKSGVILITGPTGSGKTTTLYALLNSLNKNKSYQTITLEDPIEKRLEGVIQVQINEQAGITYHTGLKAALRHDPDILMVGELRDEATARFAFQAALTGHLILSTLHAKNTIGTVHRLLDLGINKQDLLQSLLAVAGIELIPIIQKGEIRRAAIMEILYGNHLEHVIRAGFSKQTLKHSFQHLRRKAYAYGFSPEAFG